MTNAIKISDNFILFKLEDGSDNFVWADIKMVINDLKMNHKKLSLENISECLCATDEYKRYDSYESIKERIDMHSDLYIENDLLNFEAKGKDNCTISISVFNLNTEWNGNCVDDFIKRGVIPKVKVMNDLVNKIINGKENRKNSIEYRNTVQYEMDFSYINLIKSNAKRLIELCDRQLDALSDSYA